MPTLLIYPIKYLNATLLPYGSLIDKTILLISTLWILIDCLLLWNKFLIIPFFIKNQGFFPFLYYVKKKR